MSKTLTLGRQVFGWFCAGLITGSFYTSHRVALIIGGVAIFVILCSYFPEDES